MDILRKELNGIYASQHLEDEMLEKDSVSRCKTLVKDIISIDNACYIITDAAKDVSYLIAGRFASLLGLTDDTTLYKEISSSDEDLIYNRIHPEDLVDKRILEYEFFKHVDDMPAEEKVKYKATCHFRIKDRDNRYIMVKNSTQILMPSPAGRIWLILCRYDFSPNQNIHSGIIPKILNNQTGEVLSLSFSEKRKNILSIREKEILLLIKEGKPSKQIADTLGISVHTVNRHRQNILEKLSVGNSVEAIVAATSMGLV